MFGLFAGIGASLALKVRVWNALVRPVLLYGCGTWGLTAALTEKPTFTSDGRLSVAQANQERGYLPLDTDKTTIP